MSVKKEVFKLPVGLNRESQSHNIFFLMYIRLYSKINEVVISHALMVFFQSLICFKFYL